MMSAVLCGIRSQNLLMFMFNFLNIKFLYNCMMKCLLAGKSKGLKCYGSVDNL